jgi:hypothetical protein
VLFWLFAISFSVVKILVAGDENILTRRKNEARDINTLWIKTVEKILPAPALKSMRNQHFDIFLGISSFGFPTEFTYTNLLRLLAEDN